MRFRALAILSLFWLAASSPVSFALEDEECYFCHGDAGFAKQNPDGTSTPLYIDQAVASNSLHGAMGCTFCHSDIAELPHPEGLKPVNCAGCHEDQAKVYAESLHGKKLAEGDPLAPTCSDCHGKHDIKPSSEAGAPTNPIHIPETCGVCHAENAPVARTRDVPEQDILRRYSESIHAQGLLQKGLKVTAVCTSCHTAHQVLPHTDPASTINRDNVAATCQKCHALIEQVHRKVINGALWEAEPDKVPVCVDCHQPHEARKVFYDEGISDRDCMTCHAQPVQGASHEIPAVDTEQLAHSAHGTRPTRAARRCAQCHTGANPTLKRPCETVIPAVDCSICHTKEVEEHKRSIHGQMLAKGDPDAPHCLDCHSSHGTLEKIDPASPTFTKNIPNLCGRCHRDGEKAAKRMTSTQTDILPNYTVSIHGKGLLESGLLVTATCTSCHTTHEPLPARDPASSVNPANIADTCGKCHEGVEEVFLKSIHSAEVSHTDKPLPVCSSCHTAHTISRTDEEAFQQNILQTCGQCHRDVADTYFDTYHGKVSKLGGTVAAKCYDCHGAHDVLPITDPRSHISRDNIVATCGKCHEGSHRRFAGYLTHATHHDPAKYPALFFAFWGMTALLVGTFGFFGLHTVAWLPRSFKEMRRKHLLITSGGDQRMFQRFDPIIRQMHFVLILSFFGLALTGMTLKFSYMPWALRLSKVLGGFHAMGVVHRVCAVVMVCIFIIHLGVVLHRKRVTKKSWMRLLLDSHSLIPNLTDFIEFYQTIKWFLRMGPRPQYGLWTYWEKFDYFAVFWGVAIIGSTGFILWFPEFCTHFMPGWFINVATIIHSDEALLAVGFIFTIHFFNTHFRPEKFPMDMAMFTGRIPVEELAQERPRYYKELVATGELEKHIIPEAPKEFRFWAALFGTLALIIGFSLVLFILWSMVFGYR